MNGLYQCPYFDVSNLYTFRQLVVWIICTAIVAGGIGALIGGMAEASAQTKEDQAERLASLEREARIAKLRHKGL